MKEPSAKKKTRCTKKDCNNHGKCKGTVLRPKCACNRGYEGAKCQKIQSDCLKRDVDYYGDDIPGRERGAIKSSHDECAKTCQGISACKFWTWNASSGRCWPKHGQGKRRDVKNVISGSKFCGNPVIRCSYNGNECDRRNSRCVKRTDLHSGCTSGYLSQCVCSAPGTGINCWFGNAAKRCGEAEYCVRNDNENRVCKSGKQNCHCKKRIATSNPISGAYVEVLRGHDVSCDSRGCFDSNKGHKIREAAEERCNVLAECAMIMYWPPSGKFVLRRIDDPVKSTGRKTVVYAKVGGTYTATIKGRSIKCSGRCLNGNKAYAVKEVAVGKCLITPGCDSVMRSGNGKFYLRALSASSRPNSRFEVFTTPKRRKTCPKSRPNGKSCRRNCDCETLCLYRGNKNSGKKCHC